MMCQQWFSVAGLMLDIVGVMMIVVEWHMAFRHYVEERKAEIDGMMTRWVDKMEGRVPQPDLDADSPARGRGMWALLMSDVKTRGALVYVGIGLVVLGFVCQLLGSLPGGVPYFGFKTC